MDSKVTVASCVGHPDVGEDYRLTVNKNSEI